MPIYKFECKKCGHVQEIGCRVDGDEYKHMPCEKCGVSAWKKIPAVSNFVLSPDFKKNM